MNKIGRKKPLIPQQPTGLREEVSQHNTGSGLPQTVTTNSHTPEQKSAAPPTEINSTDKLGLRDVSECSCSG